MIRVLLSCLMLLGMLPGLLRAAPLVLNDCAEGGIALRALASGYDEGAQPLTVEQVVDLPMSHWQTLEPATLVRGAGKPALWLRLEVENRSGHFCQAFVLSGSSNNRDVQFYQQRAGLWIRSVGGASYPLREWSEQVRLPAFPVLLEPGERSLLLMRVDSTLPTFVLPELVSHEGLLLKRMAESLADGVVFGMVSLLVLFSLALGRIFRLRLLIAHSMAVLAYCLYVALANGYGLVHLWPDSPRLDLAWVLIANCLCSVLVFAYLRVLLQVRRQPRLVGIGMTLCQIGFLVCGVGLMLFPAWAENEALAHVRLGVAVVVYLVLWIAVFIGFRMRLGYDWFCYLLPSLLTLQFLLVFVHRQGWSTFPPFEYSFHSFSTLPGAVLLLYTLVSQVAFGRRREKQALADIEQLKQAEQERLEHSIAERTAQLGEALRNQQLLMARIGHDLRTPLLGMLDQARTLPAQPKFCEGYARSIERSVNFQLELIDELLEYARNDVWQLELLAAPGYLFGFLKETREQGRYLAERHGNRLICHFDDDLPLLVNADFRRLRQTLVNLLANAAKFTHDGEIHLRIERLPDVHDGQVTLRFCVQDTGIGIAAKDLERLQEPFSRGSNVADRPGVGLGLYIVQQMLGLMGSRLKVESVPGQGSRFSFELKVELAREQELDQVFIESYSPQRDGQGQRVLIVDDIAITREMLYELLAGYGYDAEACGSGDEALRLLQERPVDILILDQLMPDMDGWALLAQVRQRWPGLPVVLYSASPPRRPEQVPDSLCFDACLLKPVQTDDLLTVLERLPVRNHECLGSA
ncbi:response regulator [Pseudomonas sp. ABC1]|uniref:hybrid sensor histidine kinase/response regulator n=1 Tax=Pseudomonas sp. ABC1 TaxID=2748080 RepID=UPI0015C3722B|nr:ATP-binding protein [Pseudomonas sp. ABC1]QLF91696.1 response regulator [Pseudomonas sp. ABC1]